ncbi:MAG TPA: DHA2 family efflux MFS transporter permease subunit [Spongiibacteraceae bacterium]|nr:DHA2 family efflux MFS transporter permease subunit [Spongiibacteraceae bacterium]
MASVPPSTVTPPPPLHGTQLLLGSIALALATFMNVLDTSIANVSIPTISGDLGVSPNQGTWVITSFAVANAISVPLTGWLTMRFGQVRLFVASVILFVIASWLCGLAPNIQMLIAARILQGAVAGPMIPLSQALLLNTYPKEKSGIGLSIWAMTTLVAPVAGPLLGGWISDNYSWPWIFYINLPIGLICAAIIWQLYRTRESATRKLPIDTVGLALLVVWVGSLQVLLDKGKELDWFNSGTIVALALIAVMGFVFFLIWELNEKHPVVDLTLFKRRNFWAGVIVFSLGYGTFFGNLVILPLWLQTQIGYTAIDAGLILAPVGLLAIMITPIVGKNLTKWDPRWVATTGFSTFALVFLMRSHFTTNIDIRGLMIPTIIQGIPMALFFVPLTSLLLSGLPPERIPPATGLANFCRIMLGGFGSSIATTMWDRRSALHHAQLTEGANIYNPVFAQSVHNAQLLGANQDQARAIIERSIEVQAGMLGANDIFFASSMIFLVLIGFIWLARPIKSAVTVDAGAAH